MPPSSASWKRGGALTRNCSGNRFPAPFPIPHHSAFFILPSAFTCGPQLFVRDPARRGFHAISGLQDIGKLIDSVLYVAS